MGYVVLILGLALWWGAHLFKRMAPARRAEMGDRGKGLVALGIAGSILLMVLGYSWAESYDTVAFPPFLRHVNNLLVLIAIWLMSPAGQKGKLLHNLRHPMLLGFALWAAAHLLVNYDPASLILFGGLLIWALAEIVVINRAEPDWTPGEPGTLAKDGMFMVASVVLLVVIGWIHGLVGPSPFPM